MGDQSKLATEPDLNRGLKIKHKSEIVRFLIYSQVMIISYHAVDVRLCTGDRVILHMDLSSGKTVASTRGHTQTHTHVCAVASPWFTQCKARECSSQARGEECAAGGSGPHCTGAASHEVAAGLSPGCRGHTQQAPEGKGVHRDSHGPCCIFTLKSRKDHVSCKFYANSLELLSL